MISTFKEFNGGETVEDRVREFFSKEIDIISEIEEMLKDYSDDDISIPYNIYVANPKTDEPRMLLHGEGKTDLVGAIISTFGKDSILNNLKFWQKHGHGMQITMFEVSTSRDLAYRLQSVFPQLTIRDNELKDVIIIF